jgi:hypothetical protein
MRIPKLLIGLVLLAAVLAFSGCVEQQHKSGNNTTVFHTFAYFSIPAPGETTKYTTPTADKPSEANSNIYSDKGAAVNPPEESNSEFFGATPGEEKSNADFFSGDTGSDGVGDSGDDGGGDGD